MFNTLRLRYYLRQAIDLGTELSQFGPNFRRMERRLKLETKIVDLQKKTKSVAPWNAQLKLWFQQVITEPSWRQAKIERRTFKTLTRI